jgi:hypothetical protein
MQVLVYVICQVGSVGLPDKEYLLVSYSILYLVGTFVLNLTTSPLVKTKRQTNLKDFKRFGAFKGLVEQKNVVFNSFLCKLVFKNGYVLEGHDSNEVFVSVC